VSNILKGPVF